MPNPMLNERQLKQANALLEKIRKDIVRLAKDDAALIFAFRRKIRKELTYDERDTPAHRKRLKKLMRALQKGRCPICKKKLPEKYAVLDRFEAIKGYVEGNVRLIDPECDIKVQSSRGYR